MTKRTLPALAAGRPMGAVQTTVMPRALDRWNPTLRAAADSDSDRTISVYDVIGYDFWTGEGVTAKRIAGALRGMGAGPVTLNINSPGGDLFEGIAIYNLLREHDGAVTAKVLGMAASAASVIAMAADTIQVSRASFVMVHDVWSIAIGNRHDLRDAADFLEPLDVALADVYAARTGGTVEDMAALMDAETWMGGAAAIERGFADEFLPSDQVERSADARAEAAGVTRRIEVALRNSGMSRTDAQRLISEFKSSARDSAGSGASDSTGRAAIDPAQAERLHERFDSLTTLIGD